MNNKQLTLSLVLGLVSSILVGCAGSADNTSGAKSPNEDGHSGYGYEMLPLAPSASPEAPSPALMPNGRVAPEEIQRQAVAHLPDIQKCKDASPEQAAKSETIVVKMRFEASGALISSTVEAPKEGEAALGTCIANALGTMKLPAATKGELTVVYPVALR